MALNNDLDSAGEEIISTQVLFDKVCQAHAHVGVCMCGLNDLTIISSNLQIKEAAHKLAAEKGELLVYHVSNSLLLRLALIAHIYGAAQENLSKCVGGPVYSDDVDRLYRAARYSPTTK